MNKNIALLKNTLILLAGRFSTQLVTALLLPLYTTYLITSEYGYVDLLVSYVTLLVPIIALESESAVFRFLMENRDDFSQQNSIISTSVLLQIKTITIASIAYLILLQFIDIQFGYLILLYALALLCNQFLLQTARGLGKVTFYSISSFITGVCTMVCNIVFIVYLNYGALGMILSLIIANFVGSLFLAITLQILKYIELSNVNAILNKKMLHYSLPLIPNRVSWWIVNISDRTIVTLFLGLSANGIYAIATKFPSILASVLTVFSMSWTESASLHIDSEDRDDFFSSVMNNSLKIIGSLILILIATIPYIFPILIGNKYIEAYDYIPVLLLGSLFNMFVLNYSAIYIAKKRTKEVMYTSMLSAILNIALNVVFIPFIGLYAACLSTAVSYLAMAIYRAVDVKKYVSIKYNWKTIISIIIQYSFVTTLYYFKNDYLDIINILFSIVCSILLHHKLIKNIFTKTFLKYLK